MARAKHAYRSKGVRHPKKGAARAARVIPGAMPETVPEATPALPSDWERLPLCTSAAVTLSPSDISHILDFSGEICYTIIGEK